MAKIDQNGLARVAEACAMALGGALICGVPPALRAQGAGGSPLDAYLAAVAVMLCVLTPLALLLPSAARGWRSVVGETTSRKVLVGLAMWILLSGALFMFLGTFLKAKTHHRGLGGATFGVFAALSAVIIAVLVARGMSIADSLRERPIWRWPLRIAGATVVCVALGAIGYPLLSGGADKGVALARAAVFDVLLGAVVVSVLLTRSTPQAFAGLTKATLPIALGVVVFGFVRIETANAASAVKSGGGAVATILTALESWTDQDGDGVGSHFGGRDCDEGDPLRRPGAADTSGDGIDHNCDGSDGIATVAAAVAVAKEPKLEIPAQTPTADTAATVVASAPKPPSKPDIIIVTLDTVRADHTTPYGYAKKTTPNLKALAARGIVFEHAYGAGSDTQRALIPVVSGTNLSATPHTNKEWPRIREEANTVAERMKAAGYTTGAVSSFTWVRKDRGFAQGFDELDQSPWKDRHPEREHTGDLAIKSAIKLYEKMSTGSGPMYLWVHLFDAHDKYIEHEGIQFGKGSVGRYDGEIAYVDQQLGKLMAVVSKGARSDRTLWIVHGTHGEAFGEHGQAGHGMQLYDESLRVPLIIAAPWSQPARYDTDAVSVLDIAPTVLELAGGSSDGTAGVSLRAVVDGKPFEREPIVAFANRRVAVVDWPLKMHVFRRGERRDRLILFDMTSDPGEEKDVSADHKEALVRLDGFRRKAEESAN